VTDDQEKMNDFFQQNKLVEPGWLAMHTDGASSICSVRSGFTTLVNKRALNVISSPCVLHHHALSSTALPEYSKTVSKHAIELVNFIIARARLFKVLYKDELIDLQCYYVK